MRLLAEQEREHIYQVLVLVEAAIEGADMGDKRLKETIACWLLEIITLLEPEDP